MLWQIRSAPVPALVGTIPSKQAELIQLFDNSTITSHFGGSGSGIDYRAQSGLRLEAGLWLDEDRQYALEGSFFQLGQGRQQFQAASKGGDVLGPIFFRDSLAGQELLIMEAVPGLRASEMTIEATQHLWGAEANVFRRLGACPSICLYSPNGSCSRWALAFSASAQPSARTAPSTFRDNVDATPNLQNIMRQTDQLPFG